MVKFTALLSFVTLGLSVVSATPIFPRAPTDTQIFQFALTLEHLENAFYTEFLSKFTEDDFTKAGFKSFLRGRINQIAEHEATHVAFLTKLLGSAAPAACTYNFGLKTVADYVSTAASLETGGVSAYLGAIHALSDKDHVSDAGSILTTEARQAAYLWSSGLSQAPWSGSFDVTLTPNAIISVVHSLITSCPSSNPKLIATPFPSLGVEITGSEAALTFDKKAGKKYWLALIHGLNESQFVPITGGSVKLPSNLQGVVFFAVTDSPNSYADENIVAGVVPENFPFLSSASNSQ